MVTALVLMHVDGDSVDEVAQGLIEWPGVSEVYSIAGEWDLVAVLRVARNEDVADVVTQHILKTPGVEQTETLIAFKAYSRHDLEQMFSIGFGEGGAVVRPAQIGTAGSSSIGPPPLVGEPS